MEISSTPTGRKACQFRNFSMTIAYIDSYKYLGFGGSRNGWWKHGQRTHRTEMGANKFGYSMKKGFIGHP